jgi:hypothetical protein
MLAVNFTSKLSRTFTTTLAKSIAGFGTRKDVLRIVRASIVRCPPDLAGHCPLPLTAYDQSHCQ